MTIEIELNDSFANINERQSLSFVTQADFDCFLNVQISKYLSLKSEKTFRNRAEADMIMDLIHDSWMTCLLYDFPHEELSWEEKMLFYLYYKIVFPLPISLSLF